MLSSPKKEKEDLIALLKQYKDCFAWTYDEMPGLDLEVAVHRLSIDPTVKPVKQAQRRMNPVRSIPVNTEVDKMETAGLIEPCDYSSWLSNIVVVRKKSGQIRVCVDLRDVNKGFLLSFSSSSYRLNRRRLASNRFSTRSGAGIPHCITRSEVCHRLMTETLSRFIFGT